MSMLLTRSQAAFTFTAERLFKQNEHVYFWTFTFIDVPATDEHAMEDWDHFRSRLVRAHPDIQGLRVCELHKTHGIHFHFLINKWISVWEMKRMCYGNGNLLFSSMIGGRRVGHRLPFGRMSVKECDASTIGYLTKYMTKQYRDTHWFGRRRRWGTIGCIQATRCQDIEYISEVTRNRRRLYGQISMSYAAIVLVTHYTNMYGHLKNWPTKAVTLCLAQKTRSGGHLVRHQRENEPF